MAESVLTLDEYTRCILRPGMVAAFGETAIKVFELAAEETGDLDFAAQLALAVARSAKDNSDD
jgi:hypothetical protein